MYECLRTREIDYDLFIYLFRELVSCPCSMLSVPSKEHQKVMSSKFEPNTPQIHDSMTQIRIQFSSKQNLHQMNRSTCQPFLASDILPEMWSMMHRIS